LKEIAFLKEIWNQWFRIFLALEISLMGYETLIRYVLGLDVIGRIEYFNAFAPGSNITLYVPGPGMA
jgi:hypothetical protein